MLLCGDIGGTKTRLALFRRGRPLEAVRLETYASREAGDLGELLAKFLASGPARVDGACFGVAGPVRDGRVEVVNLPWVVDTGQLAARLGAVPVVLLNDLEALAHGVGLLPESSLAVLNPGRADAAGNRAVIAAGTGLGEAGLFWDGTSHQPFASEGGHADFAPRSVREIALLAYLLERYEHVSYERVLSGPGLVHIFEFLRDVEHLPVPPSLAAAVAAGDPAAAIADAALAGEPPIATATLDVFAALYGAEAGNLALKLKATGGVYVGGGIAPKILPKLQDGTFRAAFLAKGRFRALLADVPVRVVCEDRTALYGAASFAEEWLATRAPGGG